MRQHTVLGYCGKNRTADVTAKGASCVSTYGRWYTPGTKPSLQECARRCTACDSCRFVSFSAQTVDCSLYAACDVAHLTRGYGYTTLDVQQLSASDLLESPSPPISPPPPLALRHNWSTEMSAAVDGHTSGEWHGRLWIPPFKLMSTHRARELTRNRSLLFVGDSTARRFAATLARFLVHASEPDDERLETDQLLNLGHHRGASFNDELPSLEAQRRTYIRSLWLTNARDLMNGACRSKNAFAADAIVLSLGSGRSSFPRGEGELLTVSELDTVVEEMRRASSCICSGSQDRKPLLLFRTLPPMAVQDHPSQYVTAQAANATYNLQVQLLNHVLARALRDSTRNSGTCAIRLIDFGGAMLKHGGLLGEIQLPSETLRAIDQAMYPANPYHASHLGRAVEVQQLLHQLNDEWSP